MNWRAKLDTMRPCVRLAFEKGASDEQHFSTMRHAIICELKGFGLAKAEIKQELMKWNLKCYRRLSEGDAKRQLCAYVDWFFKNDCKVGCRALADYCTKEKKACPFDKTQCKSELRFDIADAILFLEKKFKMHGNGQIMGVLLRVLLRIRNDKGIGNFLYVGLREVQARLLDEYQTRLDRKTIARHLYRIAEAGMIRVAPGKAGTFSRRANGYEFLEWSNADSLQVKESNEKQTPNA